MRTKFARIAKYAVVPVFAIALASGGSALVGAHSTGQPATAVLAQDVTTPTPSPSASPDQVARFHGDATTCPMPPGVTLQGNWTHGDYVSSWAKTGDQAKTLAAAQSDCGKPVASINQPKSHDDGDDDAAEVESAQDAKEQTDADKQEQQADVQENDGDHQDGADNNVDNQDEHQDGSDHQHDSGSPHDSGNGDHHGGDHGNGNGD